MPFEMNLIDDVADVMRRIGEDRWEELERHLVQGSAGTLDHRLDRGPMAGEAAIELVEEARSEIERERNITRTRRNLHQRIADAQAVVQGALREIKTLADLGDVEYEGGDADTEHCLGEALRQLRLAQAIKPSDKDGN
ncbi:hypothetical protein ACFW2V_12175 [Streptomyces sp. NPDC058947]|uniref:hypothetical protein n=1 Tax=Streptomyces sp. NPDC058947 TaxID=3346675 RepID=UPI00367FB98A